MKNNKPFTTLMKYKVYPLHSLTPFSFTAKNDEAAYKFCNDKYGINGYRHLQREDTTDYQKNTKSITHHYL